MGASSVWAAWPPVPQVSTERPARGPRRDVEGNRVPALGSQGSDVRGLVGLNARTKGQGSRPARTQEHLLSSRLQTSSSVSC